MMKCFFQSGLGVTFQIWPQGTYLWYSIKTTVGVRKTWRSMKCLIFFASLSSFSALCSLASSACHLWKHREGFVRFLSWCPSSSHFAVFRCSQFVDEQMQPDAVGNHTQNDYCKLTNVYGQYGLCLFRCPRNQWQTLFGGWSRCGVRTICLWTAGNRKR